MQRRSLLLFAAIVMAVLCVSSVNLVAEESGKSADLVSIAKKTAGMKRMDGLFPLDWDARSGKLYLEIGSFNKDFLMLDSLPYGVGSSERGSGSRTAWKRPSRPLLSQRIEGAADREEPELSLQFDCR